MRKKKLIEEGLSYKIIGVLYKVHNKLGPLQQEKHYQRAINNELLAQKLNFQEKFLFVSNMNIEKLVNTKLIF